jgi:hypothetical protein
MEENEAGRDRLSALLESSWGCKEKYTMVGRGLEASLDFHGNKQD